MPYRNKQMLRDANGDLIPQYWDVVEQDFKPLTGQGGANDVRLTWSNAVFQKMHDGLQIRDTSEYTSPIVSLQYKNTVQKYVGIFNQLDQSVNWQVIYRDDFVALLTHPIFTNVTVPASSWTFKTGVDYQLLDTPFPKMYSKLTASIAPTSGQINTWVVTY